MCSCRARHSIRGSNSARLKFTWMTFALGSRSRTSRANASKSFDLPQRRTPVTTLMSGVPSTSASLDK